MLLRLLVSRAMANAQRVSIELEYGQGRQTPGGEVEERVDLGRTMGAALGEELHRKRRPFEGTQQAHQTAGG